MADELIRRVATPGQGEPERSALEVHLVMTDRTLADADPEPAQLVGVGPIPAPLARDLVRADEQTDVFVRRLYTDPTTGELAATDARRRDFPHVARMFLTARDQICRTPPGRPSLRGRHQTQWECTSTFGDEGAGLLTALPVGAPIRHADHAVAVSKGGDTDVRNGNGKCERGNLTKDLTGWHSSVLDAVITTVTPTGHRYISAPPHPPTSTSWTRHQDPPTTEQQAAGSGQTAATDQPAAPEQFTAPEWASPPTGQDAQERPCARAPQQHARAPERSSPTRKKRARERRSVAGTSPYRIEIYLPRAGEPRWEWQVARQ